MREPSADRERVRGIVAELLRERLKVTSKGATSDGGAPAPRGKTSEEPVPPSEPAPAAITVAVRDFVSESDVMSAGRGGVIHLLPRAIVTPLARETADRYGVTLTTAPPPAPVVTTPAGGCLAAPRVVALGADHGGYAMKEDLKRFLETEAKVTVLDLGTYSTDAVDYPDFAHKVALAVERGEAWRGICIDGMGLGSAMAANRHQGVRAACVRSVLEAVNAREHNDANVLCLGGRVLGDLLARALCMVFLTTEFEGGRHAKRVAKISC